MAKKPKFTKGQAAALAILAVGGLVWFMAASAYGKGKARESNRQGGNGLGFANAAGTGFIPVPWDSPYYGGYWQDDGTIGESGTIFKTGITYWDYDNGPAPVPGGNV